jgi:hypothetical protein
MSKTFRDKDYHFLRNSEYYLGEGYHFNEHSGMISKEQIEKVEAFDKVHGKYGFKSMVGNKRRRNSTRKSNQKTATQMRRRERAKNKVKTYKLINENETD